MNGADPPSAGQGDLASKGTGAGAPNHNRNKNKNQKGNRYRDPAAAGNGGSLNPQRPPIHIPHNAIECVICAEPCRALCVFGCGHSTCYSCGLRIHTIQGGACPICRTECAEPIITQAISASEEKFSEGEMKNMRQLAITDRRLKCVIDGQPLARQVCKLYENLCPADSCWHRGEQDPFFEIGMLKAHLDTDHKMHFCDICLEGRPVFLCEQAVYDQDALHQHMEGKCTHDSISFTGHPQCKFCRDNKTHLFTRFYDGETLLKHMQQNHFTCDLCNRGQFTYTFFQNRARLDQHFMQTHQVCDHPDCAHLDLMLRVFANEFELAAHKQRTHGIKAKVILSLDSSMGTHTSSPSGGGGGRGGAGPASSNANALDITFDHIYRREVINLMPHRTTAANGGGGGKHSGKKGGGAGSHKNVANVPGEAGLPSQYYAPNALPILVRADGNGKSSDEMRARESNSHSTRNDQPEEKKSREQQERELQALIDRELRSPLALANFKRCTAEFLQSRLMTSEYYNILATQCFTDPAVLAEVMPLLIATAPVESKRVSLGEYWHVKQAPETQRMLRLKHEEDAKRREVEEQQRIWDDLKRGQAQPKLQTNKGNGKGNAWQGRGGARGAATSTNSWSTHTAAVGGNNRKGGRGPSTNAWSSGPSAAVLAAGNSRDDRDVSPVPQQSPAYSPTTSSPSGQSAAWGYGAGSSSSPAPPARASAVDLTSEELYPSLPTRPSRLDHIGLIGKGKQKKGKPNAWFSK